MHILGLVEHPDHVCCRYRLAAIRPFLEARGHRLEVAAIPPGFWQRWRLWRRLRRYEAVILQRRLLSSFHLLMLRRQARRLIFDYDDAVFLRDSYASKTQESTIRRRRFAATVHAADAVVAGNDYLSAEAVRYTSPDRIFQVPTCVDLRPYPLAGQHRQGGGVQLVWIGSSSTLQGLERCRPLLRALADQLPGIRLKVICDRFPALDPLAVIETPWAEASEARELAAADIGISWLPDDGWSRGKCGLKVIQYFAAGLPVVANRVGVQAEMVQHGVTGYLAETPAQWVEALRRLANDPALRQRLGRNGRKLVLERYSVAVAASGWLRVLEALRGKAAA